MTWDRRIWDAGAPAAVFTVDLATAPTLGAHAGVAVTTAVLGLVAAAAAVLVRTRTALLVAVLSWLFLTGFGVHRFAVLTPLARPDAARLAGLVGVALAISWGTSLSRRTRSRTTSGSAPRPAAAARGSRHATAAAR